MRLILSSSFILFPFSFLSFTFVSSHNTHTHVQVFEHFGQSREPSESMGRGRDWNVDLIPKFLMAGGLFYVVVVVVVVVKFFLL